MDSRCGSQLEAENSWHHEKHVVIGSNPSLTWSYLTTVNILFNIFRDHRIPFFISNDSWITIIVSVVINALIQLFSLIMHLHENIHVSANKQNFSSKELSSRAASTHKQNLRRQRSNCVISCTVAKTSLKSCFSFCFFFFLSLDICIISNRGTWN